MKRNQQKKAPHYDKKAPHYAGFLAIKQPPAPILTSVVGKSYVKVFPELCQKF
jgi:hypothetical protein